MNRLFGGLTMGLLVFAVAPASAADFPQTDLINKQILEGYKAADIKRPSPKADDHEFLRRVFLDILGRIATPEEVIDFEQDRASNKRQKLVHRLLYDTEYMPRVNGRPVMGPDKKPITFHYADEYAEHWSDLWTVWLQSRSGHPGYRDQMKYWLYSEVFSKNLSYKEMVEKLLTATGKTNENGAVNFLAHQLGESNPAERRDDLGPFDTVPATSRVVRLFLGVRIQCSQCHDHPFNQEWVQSDFWGVNAFFRQTMRDGTPTPAVQRNNAAPTLAVLELTDTDAVNKSGIVFWERRDGKVMASKPAFLKDFSKALAEVESGEKMSLSSKTMSAMPQAKTRRQALAEYVTNHDMFAKAYVNRLWAHFFGRGLNKNAPADDFGSENPVIHPELLNALGADFKQYNYDSKMLMEWICNSDPYQLSHVARKEYADPKYDPYFARMPLKALTPEVLFESIMTATKGQDSPNAEQRKNLREQWMAKLVRNFGDDEGNEVTFNGTIIQALLMMNGREINDEISSKGSSAVSVAMKKHTRGNNVNVDGVIDELFLMTLNRHPTNAEKGKLKIIQSRGVILKPDPDSKPTKPMPPPKRGPRQPYRPMPQQQPTDAPPGVVYPSAPNDATFYEDIFWALLNTNEFMLNH